MKPTAPESLSVIFAFAIYFLLHLFSDLLNQKYKNTLLQFICSAIYLSYLPLFTSRYLALEAPCPKGIDNPFNMSGCEYLLFVCMCCLCGVRRFSYWFDNLGLITEGNTNHRYTASSLPLWGNTDVVLVDIKRNFWRRCRGGSSTSSRFLITNLISLQFTLFAICLSFSSPPLHKKIVVLFALFFVRRFLARSHVCLCCHVSSICLHLRLLKIN